MSLKSKLASLKTEVVEVRGESVTVRELTAGQRVELLQVFRDNPAKAMTIICAFCAFDGGEPLFSTEEADNLPPDVVDAIANTALRISGMGDAGPNA
jgi:hypothetical protein